MSTTIDFAGKILILTKARALIGRSYASLDCSNFVHEAYSAAGFDYPYRSTGYFPDLATGESPCFELVSSQREAGDVILLSGHMGIWDPEGCAVLTGNAECVRLKSDAPFLSSRGRRGVPRPGDGPNYSLEKFWNGVPRVYRYLINQ